MSPERGRMALRCPRKVLGSQPSPQPSSRAAHTQCGRPLAVCRDPHPPPHGLQTVCSTLNPSVSPRPRRRSEGAHPSLLAAAAQREASGQQGACVERSMCRADARAPRGSKVLGARTQGPGWGLSGTHPPCPSYEVAPVAQTGSEGFCPFQQLCGWLNNGPQVLRSSSPEPVIMLRREGPRRRDEAEGPSWGKRPGRPSWA